MIAFTLNGQSVQSNADPATPMLWVVRDEFGLKGTKYGCGIAQCGACTVHLDGTPVRSCRTPVSAAAGKRITTIEGLHPEGRHPLQLAWVSAQVPQCGYCQSGQIMQAADLLARNPDPSDEDITRALHGNLCRCMTYRRIREAVKMAAAAMHEGGAA